MSLAVGLEACRHVAAGLERSVADGSDVDARTELSLGSLMAGMAMNLSDSGADHALGHAIGSTLGLPHGLTVGMALAETLDVNRPACGGLLERVADALGEPDDGSGDGSRAVRAVRRLLAAIGLPTLREAGVQRATSTAWWSSLADYCPTVNPRTWTERDPGRLRGGDGARPPLTGRAAHGRGGFSRCNPQTLEHRHGPNDPQTRRGGGRAASARGGDRRRAHVRDGAARRLRVRLPRLDRPGPGKPAGGVPEGWTRRRPGRPASPTTATYEAGSRHFQNGA